MQVIYVESIGELVEFAKAAAEVGLCYTVGPKLHGIYKITITGY